MSGTPVVGAPSLTNTWVLERTEKQKTRSATDGCYAQDVLAF